MVVLRHYRVIRSDYATKKGTLDLAVLWKLLVMTVLVEAVGVPVVVSLLQQIGPCEEFCV